jgi:hypothetical protein
MGPSNQCAMPGAQATTVATMICILVLHPFRTSAINHLQDDEGKHDAPHAYYEAQLPEQTAARSHHGDHKCSLTSLLDDNLTHGDSQVRLALPPSVKDAAHSLFATDAVTPRPKMPKQACTLIISYDANMPHASHTWWSKGRPCESFPDTTPASVAVSPIATCISTERQALAARCRVSGMSTLAAAALPAICTAAAASMRAHTTAAAHH